MAVVSALGTPLPESPRDSLFQGVLSPHLYHEFSPMSLPSEWCLPQNPLLQCAPEAQPCPVASSGLLGPPPGPPPRPD